MPKRNDGNEQDLRLRPRLDSPSLDDDNPYDGDTCETHGSQTDLDPDTGLPIDDCNGGGSVIETPDGTFDYDWQDVSDICPAGLSPLQMDRLYTRLLKNHFSSADRIFDPDLKEFIYTDDPDTSKIRIVMNTTFDGNQPEILPALVIKRGRQRMQRVVIGDRGETGDGLVGLPKYVRFIQGSHRILCIGQADGFTEALAFEVFNLLNCFSPNLRRDLPLHDFQVTDMSEIGIIEDLGNTLGVAIESVYTYEYAWILEEVAPTLHVARAVTDVQLERVSSEQQNGTLRTC